MAGEAGRIDGGRRGGVRRIAQMRCDGRASRVAITFAETGRVVYFRQALNL